MNYKVLVLVVLSVFFYSCKGNTDLLVAGHRGAMGYEAENTLASVQKALELGVDVVEIDVYKCKSGEIVVFHDEKVDRLTNGEGFVEDLSFFQLKLLAVNGEHAIPLLQDVLKLVDKKCIINIELKGKNTANRVHYILDYYIEKKGWGVEDFIVSSFHEAALREFYTLNTDIPIGILTKDDPVEVLEIAGELGARSIHAYYEKLTEENVKTLQKAGYKVYAGVVNDDPAIEKMKMLGVDGVFTDFPDRVRSE